MGAIRGIERYQSAALFFWLLFYRLARDISSARQIVPPDIHEGKIFLSITIRGKKLL